MRFGTPLRAGLAVLASAAALASLGWSGHAHAQAREKFQFAITFPLTGVAASQGESANKAVGIAIKEINQSNYLGDMDLEALFIDSQAKPDIGVRALQQAISVNKVNFVITGYSGVSAAQAPVAERAEVVLVNVGGASPSLSGLSPWFFNAIPLTHLQIPILLSEVIDVMGKKNVAIIYREDDLGKGLRGIFGTMATALGGKLVAEEAFLPGTNDYRRQLARIKAANPDMVYIGGVASEVGAVIGQAASLGLKPLWTSYGAYNHKATIELGGAAAEGGVYTNATTVGADLQPLASYTALQNKWKTAFGRVDDMDYVAVQMYMGTYLLADTLKHLRAKGLRLTSKNIRDAMRTTRYNTANGDMVFDHDQDAITNIGLFRLDKGEFKAFKIYTPDQVLAANAKATKK